MSTSDATSELAGIIAANLRNARKDAGFTQHGLAIALGRGDAMTVSRWERAANRPSDQNFEALSRLLGQEIAWFYTRHESEEQAA